MTLKLQDPSLVRGAGFIDGDWVQATSGNTFEVFNPATGAILMSVPDMGAEDTTRAITSAQAAAAAWRGLLPTARAAILKRWYQLILDHQNDLATIMTCEQGKPLAEANAEVVSGARFVEWFAEEAKRLYGDVIPTQQPGRQVMVLKEPVGVVAAITPWNFPSSMVTRKVSPALAAGCTLVLKPAEDTPLSALALAELARRAGVPAGVFNVVTARQGAEVGAEMTRHPAVRKLSFTGSTAVGKLLAQQCAGSVKKVSLELGGNAPFIVFDDADIDSAIKGALNAKFRNSGQTCICLNRLLVQDGIYEAFVQRYAAAVQNQVRAGHGDDPEANAGPLINSRAVDKVERLVDEALAQGARLLTGGRRRAPDSLIFEPTILADVTPQMACAHEEVFGPVAPVLRFKTEQEALDMANDTPYGLAAYFYTQDLSRIWRLGAALEYGMVNANEGLFTSEAMPFGGIKESGTGREGSKYGIEEFIELKTLTLGSLAND